MKNELERNLALSKQQKKVDDLENLYVYAIKYNADNKTMIEYDLKRAKEKLQELKG